MADIRDIAVIGVRLYEDGREEEIEPGYVMDCTIDNFSLVRIPKVVLEDIGEILDKNGGVLC